ncbi:alpha/beta fold hydrolase [Actinocrispum wychmicini]|uniref:Alpha/beta hydrolase family protein n=1 Tax=Actinocrispum wychmicini TaxID=1213861 RepID=A0A4R2JYU7_9PSEU|nr:alpha/beta fold hydrolase [Actinocrispum wychmicini]TCO65781.1 alpha/beta hydrolase family protein [Actinocrispum wychmicini]
MTRSLTRASPRITPLRIPTAAGTFDAVAAGPEGGPKVLLLHGFPQSGRQWDHQLDRLAAAGYRAVAPDQRGYSPDVRPTAVEDYWLDYAVDDAVAMADAMGWHRFDLVGHDLGAAVAWIAAARYARRVRSLTALSFPHLGAFAGALRTDPAQQRMAKAMLDQRPTAPAPALNWYLANDFMGYDQRVTVPTSFIAGTKDPFIASSGVMATCTWVAAQYDLQYLAGVGHDIPGEAAETTSLLLRRHLDLTARGVAGRDRGR